MKKNLKSVIESYDLQKKDNPINQIREALKQEGFKAEPEILNHQDDYNFSRHILYSKDFNMAYDVNIKRGERGVYSVDVLEIPALQKEHLLNSIQDFKETFTKLSSHMIDSYVDHMIKKPEGEININFATQNFLEAVSINNIRTIEDISLRAEYKFAAKKEALFENGFVGRLQKEIKNKNLKSTRIFKPNS
jgi:hypothetical protein